MTQEQAKELLRQAGLFYYNGLAPEDDEDIESSQMLNQNDTWGWATAFGEYIPDEELTKVAGLFIAYGFCGVLYWVSEKNESMVSEFSHINRFVQFVREEEKMSNLPDANKHPYQKASYTISA